MPTLTQGSNVTGTTGYLDSVSVSVGSGFAQFESPTGTVLAQFSGSRTFGPYTNQTYKISAILGTLYYETLDNFATGSTVTTAAVMGDNGITGLVNPDGSVASISGVAASQFTNLTDRATANLPLINTPLATALAALQPALSAGTNLKTINGASLLAAGDLALQAPLVSGSTIKTINSTPLLGSGDISVQPQLVSATNIKTINGASVLGSGDLVVAANGSPTLVTHTDAIPLDTNGFGKAANAVVSLTGNRTLSLGSSPVDGGAYEVIFAQDASGSHTVSVPGTWIQRGTDVLGASAGANTRYVFEYVGATGDVLYVIVPMSSVDVTAPTLSSAVVSDTNALRIDLTWSEPMNSTITAASAFAVSSGHTVSTHTRVDSTHTYLTLATPFVGGETKTLSYTKPGTNNMKDLAGNELANFSGFAITDNVVNPTLVSAVVANATPNQITLTWSKNMSSTIPAASTFAVSAGHALTAHTYVNATTSYLTTSTNFIAGETKTLSYTPSGTNDEQDTSGNKVAAFSGVSITDNVSSGGFSVDFTTGTNGDPLSGYAGSWGNTTGWALDDNSGTFTRGMRYTGGSYSVPYRNSSLADGTFTATIHTDGFSTSDYTALVCRMNSSGAGGVYLLASNSTNTFHLQSNDPAGIGAPLDYDTGVSFTPGNTYQFQVVASGSSIQAKVGGTNAGTAQTDSYNTSGTYVGMGVNSGTHVTIVQAISAA